MENEALAELAPFRALDLQSTLISYARAVLDSLVSAQSLPLPPTLDPEISALRPGLFVTLTSHKTLRGCIGQMIGRNEILDAIRKLCYSSAFEDPRFYPVRLEELPQIKIELSLLTKPWPIENWKQIVFIQFYIVNLDINIRVNSMKIHF